MRRERELDDEFYQTTERVFEHAPLEARVRVAVNRIKQWNKGAPGKLNRGLTSRETAMYMNKSANSTNIAIPWYAVWAAFKQLEGTVVELREGKWFFIR